MSDMLKMKPDTSEGSTQGENKNKRGISHFLERLRESKEDRFKRELPHMQSKPQEIINKFLGSTNYSFENISKIHEEIHKIYEWVKNNQEFFGGLPDEYAKHKAEYKDALSASGELRLEKGMRLEMAPLPDNSHVRGLMDRANKFSEKAQNFLEYLDKILNPESKASGSTSL